MAERSPASSYLRVLIIDDSLTIRAMIEELLSREPHCHVVGAASNVEAARRMITDLTPNLITLDLNMPGINGIELLRELQHNASAPVVVVSSECKPGSEMHRQVRELGAADCFDKANIAREAGSFMRALKGAAKRAR